MNVTQNSYARNSISESSDFQNSHGGEGGGGGGAANSKILQFQINAFISRVIQARLGTLKAQN